MIDNIGVVVATVIMVVLALTIVSIKVVLFRKEVVHAFTPLEQKIDSKLGVTGNGFIPCDG